MTVVVRLYGALYMQSLIVAALSRLQWSSRQGHPHCNSMLLLRPVLCYGIVFPHKFMLRFYLTSLPLLAFLGPFFFLGLLHLFSVGSNALLL